MFAAGACAAAHDVLHMMTARRGCLPIEYADGVLCTQVWYEGGFSDYEADYRQRTGAVDPSRVKYRKMAALA